MIAPAAVAVLVWWGSDCWQYGAAVGIVSLQLELGVLRLRHLQSIRVYLMELLKGNKK